MIDYSTLPHAKPRPKALDTREAKAALDKQDREESAKAKQRAGGQCEVIEIVPASWPTAQRYFDGASRCQRRDTQTHHLLGGIGRRNKGTSILADYKLRVCDQCHKDITAHVLQPTTAEHTALTVRYRRAR